MKGAGDDVSPMGFAEILLALALLAGRADRSHAPALERAEPQLVALLQLRRENLPHALRAEMYPLAIFDGSLFREAQTGGVHPLTGETGSLDSTTPSPLDSIREFTVYDRGRSVGGFRVTGVQSAVYHCGAYLIGVGETDLPAAQVRFGRLDPRTQTFSLSGPGIAYEYSLNYYVALSRAVPQPDFAWDSLSDPAALGRLRAAIREAGGRAGGGSPSHGIWHNGFRTFDLDQDGRAEAVGTVALTRPAEGARIVWASDRGPDDPPRILAVLEQTEGGERGHDRRHLVEVMDLTGDGVAEVLYQLDGGERRAFAIHALAGEVLEEVFAGAGYGC